MNLAEIMYIISVWQYAVQSPFITCATFHNCTITKLIDYSVILDLSSTGLSNFGSIIAAKCHDISSYQPNLNK